MQIGRKFPASPSENHLPDSSVGSCFDTLSTNGRKLVTKPFVLSPSKDEPEIGCMRPPFDRLRANGTWRQ
jgi:hypothetical protein